MNKKSCKDSKTCNAEKNAYVGSKIDTTPVRKTGFKPVPKTKK